MSAASTTTTTAATETTFNQKQQQQQQQNSNSHVKSNNQLQSQEAAVVATGDRIEWSRATILGFIEDYRRERVLWDPNCKGYHIKQTKYESLKALGHKYGTEIRAIRSKIKSLRSSFHREHGKVINGRRKGLHYQPMWFAYEAIRFILDNDHESTPPPATDDGTTTTKRTPNAKCKVEHQLGSTGDTETTGPSLSKLASDEFATFLMLARQKTDVLCQSSDVGDPTTTNTNTINNNNNNKNHHNNNFCIDNKSNYQNGYASDYKGGFDGFDGVDGGDGGDGVDADEAASSSVYSDDSENDLKTAKLTINTPHPAVQSTNNTNNNKISTNYALNARSAKRVRNANPKAGFGDDNNSIAYINDATATTTTTTTTNTTTTTTATATTTTTTISIPSSTTTTTLTSPTLDELSVPRYSAGDVGDTFPCYNIRPEDVKTEIIESDGPQELEYYTERSLSTYYNSNNIHQNNNNNNNRNHNHNSFNQNNSNSRSINEQQQQRTASGSRKRKSAEPCHIATDLSQPATKHQRHHHQYKQQEQLQHSINCLIESTLSPTNNHNSPSKLVTSGNGATSVIYNGNIPSHEGLGGGQENSAATQKPLMTASSSSVPFPMNLSDEYGIFGEYVAITIRKLKTSKAKIVVKHLINNLLFEAEMGKYDHGMPSSREPPQLYKM